MGDFPIFGFCFRDLPIRVKLCFQVNDYRFLRQIHRPLKDHLEYGDCVPKSEGICRAHLYSETFDGATYDINGTCEYYMMISTKESANQSPFNVRFKSFRRQPKEMVPWIETVWFEFKSRNYKSTFVVEMSRNKISKSIATIVTQ